MTFARAAADLRAEAAALESEIAAQSRRLNDLRSRMADNHQRAIRAIGLGNDITARRVLIEDVNPLVEEMQLVEADIHVMTAILAECAEVLAKSGNGPTPSP